MLGQGREEGGTNVQIWRIMTLHHGAPHQPLDEAVVQTLKLDWASGLSCSLEYLIIMMSHVQCEAQSE